MPIRVVVICGKDSVQGGSGGGRRDSAGLLAADINL